MPIQEVKWSQFPDGSACQVGDYIVGLRGGVNMRFQFPDSGIKDAYGNWLFQLNSVGASAINNIIISNAAAGNSPQITTNPGANLLLTSSTGTVFINSVLSIGNLQISANNITATNANGNIQITPNGTGRVILDGLSYPAADGAANSFMYTNGAGILGFTTSTFPTTAGASGTILISNGTNYVNSTATYLTTTTANNILYSSATNVIGQITTANSAVLVTNASGVPSYTSSMTNGQLVIGSTGAKPVTTTLTAGTGITISNGAGSITISSGGGGYTWTEVTGTSQAMTVNNGYIANNAGLVTLTLPTTAVIGDTVIVQGKGTGLWRIAQNSGQTIHFGGSDTTTGAAGSLTATNRYDSIELLCITANTDWAVLTGAQGEITVV